MRDQLYQIRDAAAAQITAAGSVSELNDLKIRYLGKKGELTQVLRGMGKLSAEERPLIGQLANEIKEQLEQQINAQFTVFKNRELDQQLAEEALDITLPGTALEQGHWHPLSQVLHEVEDIFVGMGYTIAEGPEIETDYYNFEALNLPKDHPARDMQDSFYITNEILLRTQTSPMQVRTMEKMAPNVPVRIIAPGKVYRRDDDATHSPMFHQVEALVIDKNITFGDLRGTLLTFVQQMFGPETKMRLRPSYFPFTEPSAEVDISCVACGGKGCRVCKQTGWLEILGSGMVHPRVLEMSGYNPQEVSGFAIGLGVERTAMLKYGINDLRLLFDNDARFLRQF